MVVVVTDVPWGARRNCSSIFVPGQADSIGCVATGVVLFAMLSEPSSNRPASL